MGGNKKKEEVFYSLVYYTITLTVRRYTVRLTDRKRDAAVVKRKEETSGSMVMVRCMYDGITCDWS